MIPVITLVVFGILWFYLLSLKAFIVNTTDTISILGTIIQGMSALLSVAIAVIIFRIQTLENRNQSLEQSTLNYIGQISGFAYPQWIPSVEEHIEKGYVTERYLKNRRLKLGTILLSDEDLKKDADAQQLRLLETLRIHKAIKNIISRLKVSAVLSTIVLMLPIILSLLLLTASSSLGATLDYLWIYVIIWLCVFGVSLLIATVVNSTISD